MRGCGRSVTGNCAPCALPASPSRGLGADSGVCGECRGSPRLESPQPARPGAGPSSCSDAEGVKVGKAAQTGTDQQEFCHSLGTPGMNWLGPAWSPEGTLMLGSEKPDSSQGMPAPDILGSCRESWRGGPRKVRDRAARRVLETGARGRLGDPHWVKQPPHFFSPGSEPQSKEDPVGHASVPCPSLISRDGGIVLPRSCAVWGEESQCRSRC